MTHLHVKRKDHRPINNWNQHFCNYWAATSGNWSPSKNKCGRGGSSYTYLYIHIYILVIITLFTTAEGRHKAYFSGQWYVNGWALWTNGTRWGIWRIIM